jgi:DNA-binding transcriptional regulator GbsR (MarR family)
MAGEPVRDFVEHWGLMARSWGINPTMGELFALLYITGTDWTAEELQQRLGISRGNISMNLRELMHWGIVHRSHRAGDRRDFFRAEPNIWVLFQRIFAERKRRELDPTLQLLERNSDSTPEDPRLAPARDRIQSLLVFCRRIDTLAARLASLQPAQLDQLLAFFEDAGRTDGAAP